MPTRWAQAGIVVFWLVMTSLLIRRDVLPRFGFGELNYRQLVADRAVTDSTHWSIFWNEKRLGASLTIVRPNPDGSYDLLNSTNLSSRVFENQADRPTTQVLVTSEIHVGPLGKLQRFSSKMNVEGTKLQMSLNGTVKENQMEIETDGLSLLPEKMSFRVSDDVLLLDLFAPLDYIPDLRVGKQWTTRSINPVALVFSPGNLFGEQKLPFEVVTHEVVGTDAISWKQRSWHCYVIEHNHPGGRSKTWVRVNDGRVLRHEVPIGGSQLTIEPDERLTSDN